MQKCQKTENEEVKSKFAKMEQTEQYTWGIETSGKEDLEIEKIENLLQL